MNPNSEEPYRYVQVASDLDRLLKRLHEAPRVALDTEADSLHHYFEKVCLIQLTLRGEHFILDPLAGLDLAPFFALLADKPLVLHGADYDLRMLKADFGFRPGAGVFDTMIAAQYLGFRQFGLAALVERFFDVTLSKKGQKADWSRRPLPEDWLDYAVHDTLYLETIEDRLTAELSRLGRLTWHREACEALVEATGKDRPEPDEEAVWRIKGARDLDRRGLAFLRELWRWRDEVARDADLPPFKVMSPRPLLDLAARAAVRPKTSLDRLGIRLPRHIRGARYEGLKRALKTAATLPQRLWPPKQIRSGGNWAPMTSEEVESVNLLRKACARMGEELALPPSVIAPRAAVEGIVRSKPRALSEIRDHTSLLRWQLGLLEPHLVEILGLEAV